MTEQDIQDFWKTCEEQLKKYTEEFNNKMGVHGFKVEYIVLRQNSSWTHLWTNYEISRF